MWLQKRVLLGPAAVRKAAQRNLGPRESWMLRQPRSVRASYVREVLQNGGNEEAWMLLQSDDVRKSYVAEVLSP
jgi:hypothetical protein